MADQGAALLVIVGYDEVLADQGATILVSVGCDEVLNMADLGDARLKLFRLSPGWLWVNNFTRTV